MMRNQHHVQTYKNQWIYEYDSFGIHVSWMSCKTDRMCAGILFFRKHGKNGTGTKMVKICCVVIQTSHYISITKSINLTTWRSNILDRSNHSLFFVTWLLAIIPFDTLPTAHTFVFVDFTRAFFSMRSRLCAVASCWITFASGQSLAQWIVAFKCLFSMPLPSIAHQLSLFLRICWCMLVLSFS